MGRVTAGSNIATSVNATIVTYPTYTTATLNAGASISLVGMTTSGVVMTGAPNTYVSSSLPTGSTGTIQFEYAGTYAITSTVSVLQPGPTRNQAQLKATISGSASQTFTKNAVSYPSTYPNNVDLTFYCTVDVGDTINISLSNVSTSSETWTVNGGAGNTWVHITRLS